MLVAFDFWVSGVVLLTVGIAGMIGNLLTLWVLSCGEDENRRKNSFNRLLVNLIILSYYVKNATNNKQLGWSLFLIVLVNKRKDK
jgi:Co/Zn/Cd efflux system component